MSSVPSQPQHGPILHRLCPTCDLEILEERTHCEECGSKLIEIRDEVDTLVGTIVDGRFEIRSKLGQGGMGTVYRAMRQKSVGREIAVKLIDRSFSRDAMAVRRFLREARLASQLSQPNTVSVFDFGQVHDGRLFIAMELIRGRTLHQVIQESGAFSVERTVRIGVQICDALEAAHGLGIVHRDLKLENVIVLDHPPGRDLLKVLDFGLAKNIHDAGSRATESGIVVGTPRYMSPESSTAGVTGSAGDLYSLGVILGELSTGKPLWTGETLPELIAQKLDPKPVLARVPEALRPVLETLLAPQPERRPNAEQTRMMLASVAKTDSGSGHRANTAPPTGGAVSPTSDTPSPEATRPMTPSDLATAPTSAPIPVIVSAAVAPATAPTVPAVPSTTSLVDAGRVPKRRAPVLFIGLGALVAVVVAIVLASGGKRSAAVAQKPAVAPLQDAAAVAIGPQADAAAVVESIVDAAVATAPGTATIHVDSEPRGALVTVGRETKPAPADFVVARGVTAVEIRATLAGRKPAKLSLVPDGDKTQIIKLAPRAVASTDDEVPF